MVKSVKIESDTFQVCLTHALSTEKEEVMGLLIGEIVDEVSHIHAVILLRRLDKRKDRVEISAEQLSSASTDAEMIGLQTRLKKPLRVVGWYHSHPHITVWPSHVDVRTQAMYQGMDKDFVGLIISCFSDDNNCLGNIQNTCFQSVQKDDGSYEKVGVPLYIVPQRSMTSATMVSLLKLPEILLDEEKDEYKASLSFEDQDLLTAVMNSTVFTRSVMKIVETICSPLLKFLEEKTTCCVRERDRLASEYIALHREMQIS